MTTITVGEAVARTLEAYAVSAVYGVISIHNLPIADAIGQRQRVRFVPSRGEAGAVTMADGHTRVGDLGVALTSTGAGAGTGAGQGHAEVTHPGVAVCHGHRPGFAPGGHETHPLTLADGVGDRQVVDGDHAVHGRDRVSFQGSGDGFAHGDGRHASFPL